MPSYREYQVVLKPGLKNVVKRSQSGIPRSVTGCSNCKKRKVKCDETKSTCMRCQKRKEVCIWPIPKKIAKSAKCAGKEYKVASGKCTSEVTSGPKGMSSTAHFHEFDATKPNINPASKREMHKILPFTPLYLSGSETVPPNLTDQAMSLDAFFFASFTTKFLPPFAQVHIADRQEFQETVLQAARESESLREVFIACGASFVASENVLVRRIAHKRYREAMSKYKHSLKSDVIEKQETWLFIAAQVLQVLCLREPFANSNATRCAFHFAMAHKFVAHRLSQMVNNCYIAPIEKRLLDNFIFHYPLVIFFCDHTQLRTLVPDPFQFFLQHQSGLFLAFRQEALSEYGLNPLVAFHIAAKCSWSCRLSLPLSKVQQSIHLNLLSLATNSLHYSRANSSGDATVQVTNSITTIVLSSSIILLTKMVDMKGFQLFKLQSIVISIRQEMERSCHATTVFPIWSLMIAACASVTDANRMFFYAKLTDLYKRSKSKLIEKILVHLNDLWTVCEATQPFDLLFDTEFMSQICS